MTDLQPTENMNTKDPGAHSDGGPFPGQKPEPVKKEETPKREKQQAEMKVDNLPKEHAPTVPLPGARAATALKEAPAPPSAPKVEEPTPVVPEKEAPRQPLVEPKKPETPVQKEPEKAELPGDESPDLAETVSVWPKTGPEKGEEKKVPPVDDTPPLTTKEDVKDAKPTLEIGPIAPKKKIDIKKILIIVGGVVVVLFLAGIAYGFLSSSPAPEVVEEPVEEEVVEEVIEKTEEKKIMDVTSIDFLEDYYDGVSEKVDTLEKSVMFEETLNIVPNKL